MVVLTELALAIITLFVLIALYQFDERILNVIVVFFFLFIYAQLEEFSGPATFYAFGGVLVLIFVLMGVYDLEEDSKFQKDNPTHVMLMLIVGVFLFLIVGILSVNTGFNIITVPQLSIAGFVRKLSISVFVVLAYIENRLFIGLYEILNKRINIIISLLVVSFFFSAFHASPLWGIGTRIWAMAIFALFIAVYDNRLLGMRWLPIDIAHAVWNISTFL